MRNSSAPRCTCPCAPAPPAAHVTPAPFAPRGHIYNYNLCLNLGVLLRAARGARGGAGRGAQGTGTSSSRASSAS
jgi:hypothetical protein